MSSVGRVWVRGSRTARIGTRAIVSTTRVLVKRAAPKRCHSSRSLFKTLLLLVQRSRAALQKYLHYYNRYTNHMRSAKFENKVRHLVHPSTHNRLPL
jgi:hypothetical protein